MRRQPEQHQTVTPSSTERGTSSPLTRDLADSESGPLGQGFESPQVALTGHYSNRSEADEPTTLLRLIRALLDAERGLEELLRQLKR